MFAGFTRAFTMASDLHQPTTLAEQSDLVTVQFWMNGCAQVAHVNPANLQRCRRRLLATGAVLLN